MSKGGSKTYGDTKRNVENLDEIAEILRGRYSNGGQRAPEAASASSSSSSSATATCTGTVQQISDDGTTLLQQVAVLNMYEKQNLLQTL